MTPVQATIAACPLFAGLHGVALENLARSARLGTFREDSVLFDVGDLSRELFVLRSGRIAFHFYGPDGRMVTLGVADTGMVVGDMELVDPTPRISRACVLVGGEVVVVPREAFMVCLRECPGVSAALLRIYSRRLQYCARMMLLKDDERLLAAILLNYARRFGRDTPQGREIGLPLSQEELATHVGTSRQRLNRMLREFRERGWIATRYSTITVTDAEALRDPVMVPAGVTA